MFPAINFINIIQAHILYKLLAPKIPKPCFGFVTREKLLNLLSYEKRARKMLMKLTPSDGKAAQKYIALIRSGQKGLKKHLPTVPSISLIHTVLESSFFSKSCYSMSPLPKKKYLIKNV